MALFRKKRTKEENYFSTATIITQGTYSVGDIIGNDSIHIEGEVRGDVKVNNVVIVTGSGSIYGNVQAKQLISSGKIEGKILCDTVELLDHSKTAGDIKSNKILIKGVYRGNILSGGVFVHDLARLQTSVEARSVVAGGRIEGTIVCKELKILPTGYIRGKTFADRILNQGGHVEGFIGKYSELVQNNPALLRYAHIFNTPDETILLSYNDYYVDVEEEIKEHKSPNENEESIDTNLFTPPSG